MTDFDKERDQLMRDELHKRTMETIVKHGHQVTFVFPTPEHPGPAFGYTVGRTLKDRPELLVTGPLPPEIAKGVLNTAATADDTEPLAAGQSRDDILVGLTVRIVAVDPEAAQMNQALQFFGDDVGALQILWPDREGFFPGEEAFEEAHGNDYQPTFPPTTVDTSSRASRQHFVNTGLYLIRGGDDT